MPNMAKRENWPPGNGKQRLTLQEEEIKKLRKELYNVRQE